MRVHPSDSLSLQSGKSPLHRSSPAGSSRAGPLCKSHRPISERPVTPRVESTKPHSLSQLLARHDDQLTTRLRNSTAQRSTWGRFDLSCEKLTQGTKRYSRLGDG